MKPPGGRPDKAVGGGELLPLAAVAGALAGLAEVLARLLRARLGRTWLLAGPDLVWMAPLAAALLLAAVGLLLLGVARLAGRPLSPRIALLAIAALAFLGPLLVVPGLHPAAALLLATGLGARASALARDKRDGLRAAVRRGGLWLAMGVLALAAGVQGRELVSEHRALAHLLPAPRSAPNVLLVVLDTVRAQNLGLHGYARATTPELERLAAGGIRFERALATAPWTVPSHRSLFNGRLPQEFGALRESAPTLAEVLAARGYATAGFTANVEYMSHATRLDRGFAHYEDYVVSPGELLLSSSVASAILNAKSFRRFTGLRDVLGRKSAADVNADLLAWLSRERRRPFFVFVNYWDAHEPYLPPAPFDSAFDPVSRETPIAYSYTGRRASRPAGHPPSWRERQALLTAYDGAIAYADHQLGRLLEALRACGELERTLVVVTSDHGEQFGEHGLFLHGNSLYRQLLHVPLVISFPGRVPPGARVSAPVTLRDVPATVTDLAGLEATGLGGRSLRRHWESGTSAAEEGLISGYSHSDPRFWSERRHGNSIVAQGFHYILALDGSQELYDFEHDPAETHDLAQSPAGRRLAVRLRAALEAALLEATRPERPPTLGQARLETGRAEPSR